MAGPTAPKPGRLLSVALLGRPLVELTRHALDRMTLRGVPQAAVLAAVAAPHETGLPTKPGRERVRRHLSARWSLDVVYALHPDRVAVITVFKRPRRVLRARRRRQ